MARQLKEFPGRRRSQYNWDEWLDGQTWLLRRGEDYNVSTDVMRANVSKAAAARGMKVQTKKVIEKDGTEGLAIQAIECQITRSAMLR